MAPAAAEGRKRRLSGWCMDGMCLPSVATRGCPGTFSLIPDCECECHQGNPSERAVRIARNANLAAARASSD